MSSSVLILSAGRGRRLNSITKTKPKPLANILGLAIIERNILAAKEAGFKDFFIVIGYLGEKIKQKLGSGKRYGVSIDYIENRDYLSGNAVSVLKARKKLGTKKFLLIMGDHLYGREFFNQAYLLKENKKKRGECIIFVDSLENKSKDEIKEATKVYVDGNEVRDIGKEIKKFNFLDTGAFICSVEIFNAIEKSLSMRKERCDELFSALKILADSRKIKAEKIASWWVDIDEEEKIKKAENLLLKSLIKENDGFISKNINRKISLKITKYIADRNIEPNMITIASFFLTLISAILFAKGEYSYLLAGAILIQLASIVDGVDGEIARLKFKSTEKGAWFDRALDRYGDAFAILGLAYGEWIKSGLSAIFLIAYLAILGSFMTSYTAIKTDQMAEKKRKSNGDDKINLNFRFGRDTRAFLIFLGAILNQVYLLLILLALITNAVAVFRVYK